MPVRPNRPGSGSRLAVCVAAALSMTVAAWAQPWFQQSKVTSSDAASNDYFSYSVSVSGDTMVLGAQGNDDAGPNSGSAYVFVRSGGAWTQQAKLVSSDLAAGDLFGTSVAVSGDTVVVGAPQEDGGGANSGSVYVFTRSGTSWTQQQKLNSSDSASGDSFGVAVAIDGEQLVAGASGDNSFTGAAYLFARSSGVWTQQSKLPSQHTAPGDTIGGIVAISGNTILAGANQNDDEASNAGTVHVFTGSGAVWTEQARLYASDAAADDHFGISVGVSGDTAVVGAHRNDDAGSDSGCAYVYTRAGGVWTQQAKLTATDAAAGDIFGYAVDVSGDLVLVGAPFDDVVGADSGSAYAFRRSAGVWTQQTKFGPADAAALDSLGFSVAADVDTGIVGAQYDDDNGTNSGSAYAFFHDAAGPVTSSGVADLTRAGGTIDGTYSITDGNGIGVASAALFAKSPLGSWASAGTVSGGTFSFAPAAGDGEYRFAIVGTDTYGNVGATPMGADAGQVAVLWNDVPNSEFAYASIANGTYTFPMTNDLDQTITFSGGASGGPLSVSRTVGDTAPAGTIPALVIDESLNITGSITGIATVTWRFDPTSDDTLASPLDTMLRFESGVLSETLAITPAGETLTFAPATLAGEWYAGSADARVDDWTLMED